MRERYVEVYDRIWIDCLNGDKFKTGKRTPDGEPDPSIFSTPSNREGIQVGTAVALLARTARGNHRARYRDLWGARKGERLAQDAVSRDAPEYSPLTPEETSSVLLVPRAVAQGYEGWPRLPELMPVSSPGVNTGRDLSLVDIDLDRLVSRMQTYFDRQINDDKARAMLPQLMQSTSHFDPHATRQTLLNLGLDSGYFVRFAYQPFDVRHLYWHPETSLLDRRRPDLYSWVDHGAITLVARPKAERPREGSPLYVTGVLSERHLTRPGAVCFPDNLPSTAQGQQIELTDRIAGVNLSDRAMQYLGELGIGLVPGGPNLIWLHTLSIGHSPLYLGENSSGVLQDWPRIPLPVSKEALERSAALGAELRQLLDPEVPVTHAPVSGYPDRFRGLGVLTAAAGGQLDPSGGDLAVTAGWGIRGKGGITMPSRGRLTDNGESVDVWLNDRAYWANVPMAVWEYTLGGYQVIKKWLSYREKALLGRDLTEEEARYVAEMVRRIAAIISLGSALDASYEAVKAEVWEWGEG